jgi:hypothetical protein
MTFELPKPVAVKLLHVNLRGEKHGDDTEPAIDLKLSMLAANDVLDLFHPKLKSSLYFRSESTDAQAEVPGVPQVLPNKLFSAMQPLAWDLELTGCKVVVDYGLGEDAGSNVELCDCKVNAFRIDPKEGGSVEVTFRVQTSNIPDGALDKLSRKLNQETQITLVRPEVKEEPKQKAIDGTVGHPGAAKAKGKDATDAFVAAHEGAAA